LQDPNGSLIAARMSTGRVVLHAFLTLSAQWFDSMAFVVLGPQLCGALLPPDMPKLQQLQQLFSIFALGHVLWLLGSFLWPAAAAKLGRRGLLAWTLGLSGFCTALVGCMPSYAEVRTMHGLSGACMSHCCAMSRAVYKYCKQFMSQSSAYTLSFQGVTHKHTRLHH
jgi:MFS family permease